MTFILLGKSESGPQSIKNSKKLGSKLKAFNVLNPPKYGNDIKQPLDMSSYQDTTKKSL